MSDVAAQIRGSFTLIFHHKTNVRERERQRQSAGTFDGVSLLLHVHCLTLSRSLSPCRSEYSCVSLRNLSLNNSSFVLFVFLFVFFRVLSCR